MNTLRAIFIVAALWGASKSEPSEAIVAHYRVPYTYFGYWNGFPYGYGNFDLMWWTPAYYGVHPWDYGYSYYPFYNFQPYYATYAAIAYSKEKDVANFAWGESSKHNAQVAAEERCGAEDCKTVVWVQGGCAALATDVENGRMGWGYAESKRSAVNAAKKACNAGSGKRFCEGRVWVCSF